MNKKLAKTTKKSIYDEYCRSLEMPNLTNKEVGEAVFLEKKQNERLLICVVMNTLEVIVLPFKLL